MSGDRPDKSVERKPDLWIYLPYLGCLMGEERIRLRGEASSFSSFSPIRIFLKG